MAIGAAKLGGSLGIVAAVRARRMRKYNGMWMERTK